MTHKNEPIISFGCHCEPSPFAIASPSLLVIASPSFRSFWACRRI